MEIIHMAAVIFFFFFFLPTLSLVEALQQSEGRLTINNSESISPFLSQEGATKGNSTVHERQHLHHVP